MQLRIKNENNGKVSKFAEGEYWVGKGADCDLAIDGPNITDHHARLIVSADEIFLSSTAEAHLIDYLGVSVTHIAFNRSFQVTIDSVTLTGFPTKTSRLNRSVGKKLNAFQAGSQQFSVKDIRILSILAMMVFVFITYLLVRIPSQNRFDYFKHQEILKRGISLSRYLAEINRDAMQSEAFNKIRVTPVSLEEGVRYAYVVNAQGNILAPLESAGSPFEHASILHLDAQKEPVVVEGEKNENIIIYPIAGIAGTIGAAIIGYDIKYADNLPVPTGGLASLVSLLVLIILSGLTAVWIVRLFLGQISRLNDEVNLAIKNDADKINFKIPYTELEHLLTNINRLLAGKVMAEYKDPPVPLPTRTVTDGDDFETRNKDLPMIPGFIRNSDHAWCLLSNNDLQVPDWSQHFARRFATAHAVKGGHLAEVIENTDLVNAISSVIDDPFTTGMPIDEAPELTLSKIQLNDFFTVIVFEESDVNHSSGNV
jgi:hypothetical protein